MRLFTGFSSNSLAVARNVVIIKRCWRRAFLSLMLALVVIVAGCAGPARVRLPAAGGDATTPILLTTVPFFPQDDYQCGPAALAMVLAWSDVPAAPEDLTPAVFTPSARGSFQPAMIAAARRYDRVAYLLDHPEALVEEIAAGHPVIVLQNLGLSWFPVWHYAVVIGFDPGNQEMILHSGLTPRRTISLKTFEHTWARSGYWGLLVLPPSRLPAVAQERQTLRAIGQLERLERWHIAAAAYQSALERWPNSLAAAMGLGVCRYRAGDLKAAEATFRAATIRFPGEGAAFNNLAQVLMDQGRKAEALDAALQAVQRGGPLKGHFERTLEKIRNH
jgi:hypothetical protein